MNSRVDPDDLAAVRQALSAWIARCEQVLQAINLGRGKHSRHPHKILAQDLYRDLKNALRAVHDHGTIDGEKRPQTEAERSYFANIGRRAALELAPRVGINPDRCWNAVSEAQSTLSLGLSRMPTEEG